MRVSSLQAIFLSALSAAASALTWSGGAAAGQAPSAAEPEETRSPAGTPTVEAPVRAGVIAGIGFPRPLAVEGMAVISRTVALGAEYGILPAVTIDGVNTSLWSLSGDLRVFPFRGAFFLGLRAGRQHVGATTTLAIGSFGSTAEVLGLDSWFLNPRAGFLWTTREGLSFGVEAGVQVPIGAAISSTLPLALYPTAQRTIDALGRTVLPTVDLLRVGLLL